MDEKKTVQFGLKMPAELKARLIEKSEATGKGMGLIVIEAIEMYLKAPQPSKTTLPPIRQLYVGAPGRDD